LPINAGETVMIGDFRLPYGNNTRVPYCESEILYGGGSAFKKSEFHHPMQEQKMEQIRRIEAHADKLSAQAAMKLAQLQRPYDTSTNTQNCGDIFGTCRHNQAYPCNGGLEAVEKKIQRRKASAALRDEGRQMQCGGGSAYADITGIPKTTAATHHAMTGKIDGLRGMVMRFEPAEYPTLCDTVMASRRVSPSYPGAPQEARRSGVFPSSADALDANMYEAVECTQAMLNNETAIKEVLSYEPINHDTPKMMLKLHDAETLRSLGKVAEAEALVRSAEQTCPGISGQYRCVSWPPEESFTVLQARLSQQHIQ